MIEMVLRALEALRDGTDDPADPLQQRVMRAFNEAEPRGLTTLELVEAVIGRRLTDAEENFILVRTEDAEGRA